MPDTAFPVEMVDGVPVVAAARGGGTLAVDMTRTRFCDTSGLHALVGARKRAQAEGGEVLLVLNGAPGLPPSGGSPPGLATRPADGTSRPAPSAQACEPGHWAGT